MTAKTKEELQAIVDNARAQTEAPGFNRDNPVAAALDARVEAIVASISHRDIAVAYVGLSEMVAALAPEVSYLWEMTLTAKMEQQEARRGLN